MTVVRRGRSSDITRVTEILRESPEPGAWSDADFLLPSRQLLVAEQEGRVAGLLLAQCPTGEEAEILTLVVAAAARRRGIGRALIDAFLSTREGEVFLEVRRSNLGAQRLYLACGFRPSGVRASYYRTPVEDALIMAWGAETTVAPGR